MNWIDRAIAYVAPARGAARAQARIAMGAMLAYEAARQGRRTDGWTTIGSSADSEITAAMALVRDRARDLVRNNPHAAKALAVNVSNKIGTGIMLQPDGRNARKNERIGLKWKRWIDECELSGRLDLYGVQSLSERSRSEAGESLVRFYSTATRYPGDPGFRLRVLEGDFIDSSKETPFENGKVTRAGIEYDQGVPTAYWLYDAHPGDSGLIATRRLGQSTRVDAADVLHYFKPLRPGQTRGISDFAPVVLRLRALDDYDDAEVTRKRVAACLAAFVTTPAGLPASSLAPVSTGSATGKAEEEFRPGLISYLKPGEGVQVADPKPSGDYADFMSVQLHAIAAGLGIPYELLTGDLSEVNYSSLRGGLVQYRAMVEADQWQVTIPQLCRPIWRRFLRELANEDASIDEETPATYTPPRFGLLDPAKEVPSMIEAIQGGVMTWPETVRREGYDPNEQLAEIAAWQKRLDELGVVITSDPRQSKAPASATPPEPDSPDPADQGTKKEAA